ncbi:hypothetical protein TrRE_jg1801 [Triparma retinervis]|uniref:diacylglycerol O-acyltransferase n=1 Tax=Triparma retinervis TaxID=2557542 RepID=A0A9W7AKU0_9STRA|nr:hypothetical protein TrRE_jg1801 [Triparma retinervis]
MVSNNIFLLIFIVSIVFPVSKGNQHLQSTGTTLVSLAREDFIVLACDSRTTMGKYISSDTTVKVRRIRGSLESSKEEVVAGVRGRSTEDDGDFVYLLGAGVSGDVVDVVHLLRGDVHEEEIRSQIKTPFPTWKETRGKTEDYVLDGRKECACIVGARMGGKLGLKLVETSGGTRYISAPSHASVGSGSLASTAYLDVEGGTAESVEECVECAVEAVKRGVENDDSSGGRVRVTLIERGRVWEGYTEEEEEGRNGRKGGGGSITRGTERELTLLSEEDRIIYIHLPNWQLEEKKLTLGVATTEFTTMAKAPTYPKTVGFPPVPRRGFMSRVALFITFHLLYLILPLSITLLPLYAYLMSSGVMATIAVLYFSSWVLTHNLTIRGTSSRLLNSSPLMKYVLSSIPIQLKVLAAPPKSPSGSVIFPCHPHGALAFNRAAVGFCMPDLWDAAFPTMPNLKVLVASAAFYVPLIRELWLASYCISASRSVATNALRKGPTAMLIYPGGMDEQIMTVRGEERIYLKKRKGFIKLALREGCEVCPVYAFGESDLYHHSGFLLSMRRWLQKNCGFAAMIISGEYGLVPYLKEDGVTLVFGEAIGIWKDRKWERGMEVTDEMVNEVHALYIRKLKELFEKEKKGMGYGDRTLFIE